MGYIRNHAIIVTGTYDDHAARAHRRAVEIFDAIMVGGYSSRVFVSPLSEAAVNGTQSFCVFPDGSKEGWFMSDEGDSAREDFIDWLRDQAYDDGSSPLSWVEVQYGDDHGETKVCADSDTFHTPAGRHHEFWNLATCVEQLSSCGFECEAGPLEKDTAFSWLRGAAQIGPEFLPGQGVFYEVEAEAAGGNLREWRHFYIVGCYMDSDTERRLWRFNLSNDPPAPWHYGTVQIKGVKGDELRVKPPESTPA